LISNPLWRNPASAAARKGTSDRSVVGRTKL
jgi:hypothetical protein